MRIYIAGPMTGLPEVNHPPFAEAADKLRGMGHVVENPGPLSGTWKHCMRLAIQRVADCDAVALLPGWEENRGARIVRHLANDLELIVMSMPEPRVSVP